MFKKILSVFLLLMFFGCTSTFAQKIYFDLSAVGITGTDDNVTGLHDQWKYYAVSINKVLLGDDGLFTTGDTFTNKGMLKLDSLNDLINGAISDHEGLNTNYEITTAWDDLTGTVTYVADHPLYSDAELVMFRYNGGATFEVYIDDSPDYNTEVNTTIYDFTNFDTARNGIHIMDITITGGTGTLTQWYDDADAIPDRVTDAGGNLYGYVSRVYVDNFIFFTDAGDFYDLLGKQVIIAMVDQNMDDVNYIYDSGSNSLITIANHDGSIDFVVPEPATLILTGSGLLALSLVLRRRKP